MQHPENNHDEQGLPFKKDGRHPFSSPDGYFDDLGKKLMLRIELEEELHEFKTLGAIPKQQAYQVPEQYFAKTAHALEYKQELSAYPSLAALAKPVASLEDPLYFENLEDTLVRKAEWVQELNASPSLLALDKQVVFDVSPDYFDNFSQVVRERISQLKQPAPSAWERVIAFIFKPQISLAFACIVAVTISILVYKPEVPASTGNCQTLACLEKSDILNDDKMMHSLDVDNLMDAVDVDKLDQQLNKPTPVKDTTASREQYIIDNINTDQLMEEL